MNRHSGLEAIGRFLRDTQAASATEYALVVGLIAVVIVTTLLVFGDGLLAVFTHSSNALDTAVTR